MTETGKTLPVFRILFFVRVLFISISLVFSTFTPPSLATAQNPQSAKQADSTNELLTIREIYLLSNKVLLLTQSDQHEECISIANSTLCSQMKNSGRLYYSCYLLNYKSMSYKRLGNYFLSDVNNSLGIEYARHSHSNYILALFNNLSTSYLDRNNANKAVPLLLYNQIMIDSIEKPGKFAQNLSNLAHSFALSGDSILAKLSFQRLMKLEQASGSELDDYDPVVSHRTYGQFLLVQQNIESGIEHLQKSLALSIKANENKYQTAKSLFHLALAYQKLQNDQLAETHFNEAIDIMMAELPDSTSSESDYETVLIDFLVHRGMFYLEQGRLSQSYQDIEFAISRIERLTHAYASESTRFQMANLWIKAFKMGVYCSLKLYEETHNKTYLDQAFEWSLVSKSLSLYWLTQRDHIYPIAGMPMDSLYKLQNIREDIQNWMDKQSIMDFSRPLMDTSELNRMCQLVIHYEILEQYIQKEHSQIRNRIDEDLLTDYLNPRIFRKENYLGYQDMDSLFIVFGVNRKERFYEMIPVDSSLRRDLRFIKTELSEPRFGLNKQDDQSSFSYASFRIYETLFKPIKNHLFSKNLAIHPDGVLLGLPFEVLITDDVGAKTAGFKELLYLMNSYSIRYVATPYLLTGGKRNKTRKNTLLVSCSVNSGETVGTEEIELLRKSLKHPSLISLPQLQHTYKELIQQYGNIHISTHLVTNNEDFLKSGLSCNLASPTQQLTFKDILFGRIRGSNIYINSCDSGNGPLNHGEGLMSLSLAYTMAGAGSVIQHLWQASNQASTKISVHYYMKNRYLARHKALQKARQKYLKDASIGKDHPFYWAGVVFYGPSEKKTSGYLFGLLILFIGFLLYLGIRRLRGL
ncbi:MAG: CHAT domain-containing protein [Bacteroidetes bacterium]|jgi:CHAT domain-containing protein|nr:CHAT domain-containing protein [Bacteroidota bacterium]MBT3750685.1 CHAT domain-containing protein [Bacteroidota bacterium]MBT4401879.1 CHAT domain-containing protein [Bacteroidota bacterium]MBT4408409.1 CHAT domain-containing protein [Bacteroidota bacterium]MBT7465833.1 CHAT domain-containing protein [Bacteroidota bacterium]